MCGIYSCPLLDLQSQPKGLAHSKLLNNICGMN